MSVRIPSVALHVVFFGGLMAGAWALGLSRHAAPEAEQAGATHPLLVRAVASGVISPLSPADRVGEGVRLRVRDDSGRASASKPMYLASNRNGWRAGDPAWVMTPEEGGWWSIDVPRDDGAAPLEFKFTLGSWAECETDQWGFSVENRRMPSLDAARFAGRGRAVVEMSVERFSRANEPENLGVGWTPRVRHGRVETLTLRGGGGAAAGLERPVWVWLPPGYDDASAAGRMYRVVVVLDGQMALERVGREAGELRFDETITRLAGAGAIDPPVVVAVPHAGPMRLDEYVPVDPDVPAPGVTAERAGGWVQIFRSSAVGGAAFADLLADTLVPQVRARFRVRSDAASTAIYGQNLGATLAYFAGSRRGDVFGVSLCDQMVLPMGAQTGFARALVHGHPSPARVWFGLGDTVLADNTRVGTLAPDVILGEVGEGRAMFEGASTAPDDVSVHFQPGTDVSLLGAAERLEHALRFAFSGDGPEVREMARR